MESAAPIAALNPNAELLESRACTVLFTIIRESTTTQRDVGPHPTPPHASSVLRGPAARSMWRRPTGS